MKLLRFKSVCFSLAACAAALIFSACGRQTDDPSKQKFDEYVRRVPENSVVFLGGYCPTDYQKKIFADAGWKKLENALRGNAALAEKTKKLLAKIEECGDGVPVREIFGDEPLAALLDATETPVAFAYFMDEPFAVEDSPESVPAWTFAAALSPRLEKTLADAFDALAARNAGLKKEPSAVGARAAFTLRERGNVELCVLLGGGEIIAASSRERVEAFANALAAAAPERCVFDSPVFAKLAAGAPQSQVFGYLNFDGLKGFRDVAEDASDFEKELRGNAQGAAFFVDGYSSTSEAEFSLRVSFAQPTRLHEFFGAMAARKFNTLGNALPNAAFALGFGVPAPTPELFPDGEFSFGGEIRAKAEKFDARALYLSFADVEKVANFVGREKNFFDTPLFFAKLEAGDVGVLLNEPEVAGALNGGNPMIGRQKIGDDEVFGTAMFGIRFAPLGTNAIYASNLPDAAAALNLAKGAGTSLADAGTFASLAKKIRGNNALEVYEDERPMLKMEKALLGASATEATRDNAAFTALSEKILTLRSALMKKSLAGSALRVEGDLIELRAACEFEFDFGALADEIEKIR